MQHVEIINRGVEYTEKKEVIMMMYRKMRPCPFCGSPERRLFVEPFSGDYDHPQGWQVCCETSDYGCGAVGPTRLTEEDAIDAWNDRAIYDAIKRKTEEIYDDGGTYDDLDALKKIVMMIESEEVQDDE